MTVRGAGRRSEGLTRRAVLLAGLAGLSACVGAVRGYDPPPAPAAQAYPGPYRLRIAIFEAARLDLPFHAGLLIDAPQGRILYDPAGYWQSDQCGRTGDVHHPIDDAAAEAWLARGGLEVLGGSWTLHLFEADVAPQVAARAHDLALSRPAMPGMTCAWSVADLLSELPGFDWVRPRIVTARLLDQLRARPDLLRYTVRRLS
jgi:hypothetical protein